MSKRKVYTVPIIQRTIIHLKVVASSRKEVLEIVTDDNCEWWNEKEEVLDTEFKKPELCTDYHDTQYAYYRNESGIVDDTQIENILPPAE